MQVFNILAIIRFESYAIGDSLHSRIHKIIGHLIKIKQIYIQALF